MTKLIPPPPPTVPIGRVGANGQVILDPNWALYLTVGLPQRVGGYNAPDITQITQTIQQSIRGGSISDEGGEDVIFVPGPRGPAGPAGANGMMIPWECDSAPEPIFPPYVGPRWGRYTPTLTNVANLDASTAFECWYAQVGMFVMVGGRVDVDPTAAGLVRLGISLPIASSFAGLNDAAGTAATPGVAGQCAAIVSDSANSRAEMRFTAVDLANRAMYFNFSYQVA